MFACLEFTSGDSEPDDVEPEACVCAQPNVCTGILLFDILIANSDRHRGNIRVDFPASPQRIEIIDHDRALFGHWENEGISRLKNLQNRLGITGGSATGENRHFFLDEIKNFDHFSEWYERIGSLPVWFLRDVCDEVIQLPISRPEIEAATEFLVHRKQSLSKIVWDHQHEFTRIPAELFDRFGQ
jgi:hypothetical protein